MRRIQKLGTSPRVVRGSPAAPGSEAPDAATTHRRAAIMAALLLLAFFGLIARLWYMQIAHGDEYLAMARLNQSRLIQTPAPRGMIVDCKGRIIATSRSQYAIYAAPEVAHAPLILKRLGTLLGEPPAVIVKTLTALKKNDYDNIRIAIDVPLKVVTRIEEERPYLPGVSAGPEPVRWYPNGSLLGNTLGTLGRLDPGDTKYIVAGYSPSDTIGKTGLEAEYESDLHGTPGGTKVEVDALGRPVQTLGSVDPIPGRTLVLAVDKRVQSAAEQVFREKHWVGAAAAVNPQTGGVVALVSSPSLNPNLFVSGISSANWKKLNTNPEKPMLNRAVDALYPPGSTFKQVVAAAGLQCGAVTTKTTAYCTGAMKLGAATFHCWAVHRLVDFNKAIAESCDIFFYQLGLRMGPEKLSHYALQYPLAQATGIDLPHEMIGSIPSPEWKIKHFGRLGPTHSKWYDGDTLNTAIGQGYVLVTPLQMALVTATTANGGYVLRPYLVQRVVKAGSRQIVLENRRVVLRRVGISPENLEKVRIAMRQCVTNGTGKIVDFPNLAACAKTGSAQVYGQAQTHGWFVAFAPFDHPTFACAAIVEHGGHGASSAGVVCKAMIEAYFHLKDNGVESGVSD